MEIKLISNSFENSISEKEFFKEIINNLEINYETKNFKNSNIPISEMRELLKILCPSLDQKGLSKTKKTIDGYHIKIRNANLELQFKEYFKDKLGRFINSDNKIGVHSLNFRRDLNTSFSSLNNDLYDISDLYQSILKYFILLDDSNREEGLEKLISFLNKNENDFYIILLVTGLKIRDKISLSNNITLESTFPESLSLERIIPEINKFPSFLLKFRSFDEEFSSYLGLTPIKISYKLFPIFYHPSFIREMELNLNIGKSIDYLLSSLSLNLKKPVEIFQIYPCKSDNQFINILLKETSYHPLNPRQSRTYEYLDDNINTINHIKNDISHIQNFNSEEFDRIKKLIKNFVSQKEEFYNRSYQIPNLDDSYRLHKRDTPLDSWAPKARRILELLFEKGTLEIVKKFVFLADISNIRENNQFGKM